MKYNITHIDKKYNIMQLKDMPYWWRFVQGGGVSHPAVLDDGNTVAWYDYEENITKDGSNLVSVWGDKSGNGNDLLQATGANQPVVNSNGVLFDGFSDFMKANTFTLEQPEFIYIVLKQISWTMNDAIFDGNVSNFMLLQQRDLSPNLAAYAGAVSSLNGDLAIGSYGIVRVLYNGASSKLQVNEETPITGNFGTSNGGGFTLAAQANGSRFSNIEVKEVIIRKIADSASDEQEIYNYLSKKYGI